ncbi:MAG: D-glycero-beta-D-manno-heptose 1-phosphate adenylyltransferase [Chlorobi bacterium]|nr:D-glycero-beta-D-manno-heptose 1-phosphate adenylyltransferase [Chlorobiota bacterium]
MTSNRQIADRILDQSQLQQECQLIREQGQRIVFTNGCFDILHLGHVTYLQQAALLGDKLIVGLNSDESVRRLKGEGRPILPQAERATLLAALRSVDYVSFFEQDTPLALIETIRPDLLVKGGDYNTDATEGPEYIVGSDILHSYGGQVKVINLVEGGSTTNIIEAVLKAQKRL